MFYHFIILLFGEGGCSARVVTCGNPNVGRTTYSGNRALVLFAFSTLYDSSGVHMTAGMRCDLCAVTVWWEVEGVSGHRRVGAGSILVAPIRYVKP